MFLFKMVDFIVMENPHRLSEYFAEMEEIAKIDPVKAIRLQHEHLKPFLKDNGYFSEGPEIVGDLGFGSCLFGFAGPSFSPDSITHIDGRFYDQDWNVVDPEDDGSCEFDF